MAAPREMRALGSVEPAMSNRATGSEGLAPWSYRDAEAALRARRSELILARRAEAAAIDPEVRRIYQRRVGRSAGGVVAIAGAVSLPVLALAAPEYLTAALLVTAALALVALAVGRIVARARFAATVMRTITESDDLYGDVARLERGDGSALAAIVADRLERASVALPMIGLALVLPLVLHFLFFISVMVPFGERGVSTFNDWIKMSLVLVGHSHLLLAWLAWRFAKRMRATETSRLRLVPGGWPAWGWSTMASALPGAVLFLIPPGIVAATGLVFIPAMYSVMRRRVAVERSALGR